MNKKVYNTYFSIFLLVSFLVLAIYFFVFLNYMNKQKPIVGIAVFKKCSKENKIEGFVEFVENLSKKTVIIQVHLKGFKKNSMHAMHIHEAGDLTEGSCMSACAHFNPYGKNHGGIHSEERHVGDLGNIVSDENGEVHMTIEDSLIKLRDWKCNIIGRSVVIHEDRDDNGKGGFPDSLTTGHAGKRIACSVIGYSKKNFEK